MKTWNPLLFVRHATRNSPWVVMSVLAHVIVIVVVSVVYLKHQTPAKSDVIGLVSVSPARAIEEPIEPLEPPVLVRTAIPPDGQVELTEFDSTYIPTDVVPEPLELTKPIGDPTSTDYSSDAGNLASGPIGVGPGGSPRGPTSAFPKRPGVSGKPPGGRPPLGEPVKTEKAVLDGMRWLLRHQNPDGSWGADALRERCAGEHRCSDPSTEYLAQYNEGLTALALLCFLGDGMSHLSTNVVIVDPIRGEKHVAGEAIKKGLKWLVDRQNQDGSFSRDRPFMYNEALCTLALAEAYGLTRNRYWKEPAQKGVDFLQKAQRPNPSGEGLWGWRYQSRMEVEDYRKSASQNAAFEKELFDSDTSVTGWVVMALKSAQLSGLSVSPASLDGAMAFTHWVTADNGLVGYIDPKGAGAIVTGHNDHFTYHPAAMSALGMCIRIFTQHDPSDPFYDLAARRIVADLPVVSRDRLSVDFYYWYYASLALNQLDGPDSPRRSGKYWGTWKKAMEDALLSLQDHTDRACTNGGWIVGDRWSYTGGPVYSTALNVLTLEVYYRYENAFRGFERARAPVEKPPSPRGAPEEPRKGMLVAR